MRYNGVISRKIEKLFEELNLIRAQGRFTTNKLEKDAMFKHGIERSLQICVEIVIDVANRIISLENQAPATNSTEAIKRLEQLKIIKDHNKYIKMVQFRNLIVHRYESIDNATLVDICHNHLTDLEAFITEISRRHE